MDHFFRFQVKQQNNFRLKTISIMKISEKLGITTDTYRSDIQKIVHRKTTLSGKLVIYFFDSIGGLLI